MTCWWRRCCAWKRVDREFPNGPYGAVVMTSANAARAIARHPQRDQLTALPAFTVGRHTAEAARAAGFGDVRSADGDKNDLVALLRDRLGGGRMPLLYLAGEDRAGDLAGMRRAGGDRGGLSRGQGRALSAGGRGGAGAGQARRRVAFLPAHGRGLR